MQKKTVLRIMILALIIVWMSIVFQFSNQKGEASTSLSQKIARIFVSDEEKIQIIEPYIRKIAHLSEYAARRRIVFINAFNVRIIRCKKNAICTGNWNRICYH